MSLRIATRKSPLALWQAEHVKGLLSALEPDQQIELVGLTTKGDKILDQALSKVGGKDLFVKEIEDALFRGEAELAVHSLKDMPTALPEGLFVAAFLPREDPRDALVSPKGYTVERLPRGARVGTSSLRRAAQLLARRPDLIIEPIRGNVQTRLLRLEERGLDATLLARAGLVRLGLAHLISETLPLADSLPAIGQGILAVEVRRDDRATATRVARLDDPVARAAATAERSFLHRLQGGCQVPIAGHAEVEDEELTLAGLVSSLDGREVYRGERRGRAVDAAALGSALAEELLSRGAGRVLQALTGAS